MPTLGEVKSLLSNYIGLNNDANTRLNLVRARLLTRGSWKGSKQPVALTIYSDVFDRAVVTLPYGYNTVLAGEVIPGSGVCGGPLGVQNEWYGLRDGGPGSLSCPDGFIPCQGRFSTFQDWSSDTPQKLRFKFEATESAGTIWIKGKFMGDDVYSSYSGSWIQGEKLDYIGAAAVTTTKKWDALGLSALKPTSNGRFSVYVVDDDGVETLVGIYSPGETLVRWRRYIVPNISDITLISSSSGSSGGGSLPASQYYTKDEVDALFSGSGTISVSAAGTHDLVYDAYLSRMVKIVATGSAYTHTFTLDNATVKEGGVLRIPMEVAQAAGIVLSFYDNSLAGALLLTVTSDNSTAYYTTAVFGYYSGVWRWLGFEGVV